jgi:hypothetical protein
VGELGDREFVAEVIPGAKGGTTGGGASNGEGWGFGIGGGGDVIVFTGVFEEILGCWEYVAVICK